MLLPSHFVPNGMKVIQVWSQRGKKRARVLRCAGLDRKGKEGDILRTYTQLDFWNTHTQSNSNHTRFIQGIRTGSCLSVCVCWGILSLRVQTSDQAGFRTVSVCDFLCICIPPHHIETDHSLSLRKTMLGCWRRRSSPSNQSSLSEPVFSSLCGVLRDSSQALCKIKLSSKNIKYSLVPMVKVHDSWGSLGHVGELIPHNGHDEMYWNVCWRGNEGSLGNGVQLSKGQLV